MMSRMSYFWQSEVQETMEIHNETKQGLVEISERTFRIKSLTLNTEFRLHRKIKPMTVTEMTKKAFRLQLARFTASLTDKSRCNIPSCTIFHHLTRANVNTCPIAIHSRLVRGGGRSVVVKTQSAKICLNFNFQGGGWGCSVPNPRIGCFHQFEHILPCHFLEPLYHR